MGRKTIKIALIFALISVLSLGFFACNAFEDSGNDGFSPIECIDKLEGAGYLIKILSEEKTDEYNERAKAVPKTRSCGV